MNETTQTDSGLPQFGSLPLTNFKHEIYARERSLGVVPERAAQRAGYAPRCGKHSVIERRADVTARIAYLSRDEVEVLRARRERIIERLLVAIDFNPLRDFGVVAKGRKRRDGSALSQLIGIDWAALRNSDFAIAVSSFKFDAKTGRLTDFDRDNALAAVAQLRDMLGFKAPSKIAPTNPEGDGPAMLLTGEVTDADRAKALAVFIARHKAMGEGQTAECI